MRGPAVALGLALTTVSLSGCLENPAPGNDREAELDPPATAAEMASAEQALAGVSVGLVMPEIMTDADQATLPAVGGACLFRMTTVGFPVAVYGASSVLKLNGKLVRLTREAEGRYGDGGVSVAFRPLDGGVERGGSFPAEMVVRLPGAADELGFHGYSTCS